MVRYWAALLALSCLAASTDAAWTLEFTVRDNMGGYSNSYKDFSKFEVLVDGKAVETYDQISGDYQYGRQTIDLTPYITEGKSNVSFRLESLREGVLLYGIGILHDGRPVRFSPWIFDNSDPRVRGYNYSDTRLIMIVGDDLGQEGMNYAQFTTQPLADAPELEIRQSDLAFSKPPYSIVDGDTVGVSVTARNLGAVGENGAFVELYMDDALANKSPVFGLGGGAASTQSFSFKADFKGRRYVKVEAKVIPSDPSVEGREDNNRAVKYILKRPSMFFTDIGQTPLMRHSKEEPYSKWLSQLGDDAKSCLSVDFFDSELAETDRSECAANLAIYYQLTKDESYAQKAVEALAHIGDGKWTWVDRSRAGSAKKGSLEGGVDENYGLQDVYGAGWGAVLLQNALAYDWVHDYVVKDDGAHGTANTAEISDRIARLTTDTYLLLKEIYSYGDHGSGTSAFTFGDYGTGRFAIEGPFGVAAMSILDYDGRYQDLDGSPDEWVNFVEKDFAVESQAGAKLSNMDQHMSREGLYEEGDGYRDYYEPSLSYFIGLYNNVMGVNMAKKYSIVDGFMKDIPLTMSPPGRYPNLCVSYGGVWYSTANSLLVYDIGSAERNLTDYYIGSYLLPPRGYRPMGGGLGTYNLMLTYDATEPYRLPAEPSYFSPNGSMNVFRSGWDRDALYSFVKAPNEPTMSGHAPAHFHQLAFDIWAKGAYPVVDAGDERFLGYGGSSIYGHTTWLFYEDGSERWIDRDTKGQYGETCNNPAYITSKLTSGELDFLEGRINVTKWYNYPNSGDVKNPFQVTRDIVMVGGEYFIVADTLKSEGPNSYSMLIPFGSADGHTGENPSDNWALGSLTVDGIKREWYDYQSRKPLDLKASKASDLVWDTFTETNEVETKADPVSMTVHLNPPTNIAVDVSGMHYGTYGKDNEWAFPYVRVNQDGRNVKYLTVYYPTAAGDRVPKFESISVSGGDGDDYATKVGSDLAMAGDGETLAAAGVSSDGMLTFMRPTGGAPSYFFIVGGSRFDYINDTYLYATQRINGLINYGKGEVSGKINACGPFTLYLRTRFEPSKGIMCRFNGTPQACAYDGVTLKTDLPGSGELSVEASESGQKPSGKILITETTTLAPFHDTAEKSSTTTTTLNGKIMRYTPAEGPGYGIALVAATLAVAALIGVYFYARKAFR
jgi:hypothetical protein